MADGNKTEQPTEKKLEDARKEGNHDFTQEVVQTAILLGGVLMLMVTARQVPSAFNRALEEVFRMINNDNIGFVAQVFVQRMMTELLPLATFFLGAIAVIGVVANIAQVGFVFQFAKIEKGLSFEQGLNPVSNVKNIVSKRALLHFLINIFNASVIIGVVYYFVSKDKTLVEDVLSCRTDLLCGLEVGGKRLLWLLIYIGVTSIPLAAMAWFINHTTYIKENMMSKDEVEREHKELEGNPEIKSHRRQMAQEMLFGNPLERVNKASAVIRNPTHIAIAVRYEPDLMVTPYIVGIGSGAKAQRMIAEAESLGIPSYIDIPLARSLIIEAKLNDPIPLKYGESVAKFTQWLRVVHPDKVFKVSEFAGIVKGYGDVKL